MNKPADAEYSVNTLIEKRWSPRSFLDQPVEPEKLRSCLEAARWAPSCFNQQPWRFIVARKEDEASFAKIADCLVPGNAWARAAGALVLSTGCLTFEHNGKPNRHAWHDVGLATAHFVIQATELGLSIHQMAGFDVEKARVDLAVPEGFDPVAVLAVGYQGPPDQLADELREREMAPRVRRPQSEFVFGDAWGKAF